MSEPGTKKQVVAVIGGGIAGMSSIIAIRKALKDSVDIVMIEPKQFVEVAWSAYRSPFDEQVAKDSIFELEPWCKEQNVQHVASKVVQLTKNDAKLENGDTIHFDVGIVCVGASSNWPAMGRGPPPDGGTITERLDVLSAEGEKLLNAGSVLVVGGGLIGVEVAGDLADYAKQAGKELKVTLVQRSEQLAPVEITKKASDMCKRKLENLGVEVILNDEAVRGDDGKMKLQSSGRVIEANEVIMTVGFLPINASFMDASHLNDKGWIQTDTNFRVQGAEQSLLAIGDCCTALNNSAVQVMLNVDKIGNNVKALLEAQTNDTLDTVHEKMKPGQQSGAQAFVLTIGTRTGVAQTPMFHTQFLLPYLKNKTMFLFKIKSELGLK